MVFYPVNTFLNRKAKSGVGKVVEGLANAGEFLVIILVESSIILK